LAFARYSSFRVTNHPGCTAAMGRSAADQLESVNDRLRQVADIRGVPCDGSLMAEAGHSRRSAMQQFDRGVGRCHPRATLGRLWSRRRTADPVPSVSDAPGRRAADERVETGQAQSAAPGLPNSGNRTQRTTRTRGHATCPSAAASIRRSKRLSGSQEPPRATNRLAASMMEPPLR
jgi:hypothetical protein